MHVSRVRAKGEAEQAGRRWGGREAPGKCRVDSVVEYLLDFSRLTRAPGPGTYPLQVHTVDVVYSIQASTGSKP